MPVPGTPRTGLIPVSMIQNFRPKDKQAGRYRERNALIALKALANWLAEKRLWYEARGGDYLSILRDVKLPPIPSLGRKPFTDREVKEMLETIPKVARFPLRERAIMTLQVSAPIRLAPGTIASGGESQERGPLPHLRRATRVDTVANGRRAVPGRVLRSSRPSAATPQRLDFLLPFGARSTARRRRRRWRPGRSCRHLVRRHKSLHRFNKLLIRAVEEAGGSAVVRAAEDVLDELGDPESTAAGEGYEQPVLEF